MCCGYVFFGTELGRLARRAMYAVSEIPSKRPSVSQKALCQEPSLSVSLCHLEHQTLIQSPLWMCAVTGQKREVCLVSGARGSPIEGDPRYGPV